jgi:hypothetical protein
MDECINENYNPQCEVSAPGVTQTRDRVLRDKTKVAHHGTPPQNNKLAGKHKDTLATGTSDSPRARQDDLARIASAWPCCPKRQLSIPSQKRSTGISKTAYDPIGAQTKRAAELRAAYADQGGSNRSNWTFSAPYEDARRMRIPYKPNQVRRRRSAAAAQTMTLREPRPLEGP